MSILTQSVWVEREGESVCLLAGTRLPVWAAEIVTNPNVLADEVAESDEEEDAPEGAGTDSEDDEDTGPDEEEDEENVTIPPQRGPGSSAAAWAEYAKAKGFAADADATAAEIREALVEAGVAVE